jgi:hypothetical protein
MIQESVTLAHVIDVLNNAVESDPDAMHALVETRVPCNKSLAEHPTIQVATIEDTSIRMGDAEYRVGIVGLLNGLFGVDSNMWGTISANFETECPNECSLPEDFLAGTLCQKCSSPTVSLLQGFSDLGRR